MPLYDAWGRPIRTRDLRAPLAGPTVTGVRSPLAGHPARGLTPGRLAGLLLAAEQGDETAYLELAEEMEEKDLHYRAVLATRKLQVAGLEMTVEAASDAPADVRAADLVRDCLDVVRPALFDMLDALGKGFSVCEILWETSGSRWAPREIVWRDPRWFTFEAATGGGPFLRGENGLPEPLAPAKFLVHTPRSKSGLPIRGGLARAAAWCWLFKNFDLKAWVLFAEVYGHPLRVGRYGPEATEEDRQILLRAVRDISSDHAAIIPQSMALEFIDARAQGNADIFERLADYLDRQMSKLVLGQTGTTDTGSRVGTADAHERVRADIERADAGQLAATLNRDLVTPLVRLNLGDAPALPRLRLFRPEQEDLDGMVARLAALVPLGLRVEASAVRDRLGFPDPDPGAPCLGDGLGNGRGQGERGEEGLRGKRGPLLEKGSPSSPSNSPISPPKTFDREDGAPSRHEGRALAGRPPGGAAPDAASGFAPDAAPDAARDDVDDMTDELLDGWQPLMEPAISEILALADGCGDYGDFEAGLARLAAGQTTDALARALGRACFVARAAHAATPDAETGGNGGGPRA